MPQSRTSESLILFAEHEHPEGLTDYLPLRAWSDTLALEHVAPYAEYTRTNVAPFNVLRYLHCFGQILVDSILAGYTHRHIYDFLRRQPRPIPVSYRQFSRGLELFRRQKGLPPSRVLRTPPKGSAAAGNAPAAPIASFHAATPRVTAAQPAASSTATPYASAGPTHVVAASLKSAAVLVVHSEEALSPEEIETRRIEARLATMFRPFTAEDAKRGKPIMEAIADKERQDLEEYERGLKDGTITDW